MKTLTLLAMLATSMLFTACVETEDADMDDDLASREALYKPAIDAVVKAWNTNDPDAFKAVTIENITRTTNGNRESSNQTEYAENMNSLHTGFPDFMVAIDKVFIRENKAYINWTVTGTNTGEFQGFPPTGAAIETHGFSIWSFDEDGKGTGEDAFFDNLDMFRQMGYALTMPEAEPVAM